MKTEELLKKLMETIGSAVENAVVRATAQVNRGVCAGSVTYHAATPDPKRDATLPEVMRAVRDAYHENGLEIDITTDTGATLFFQTFLHACRVKACEDGGRCVNIVGLLSYEPTACSDGSGLWLRPCGRDRDFNRLPAAISLSQSLSSLAKKRRAARQAPFDLPAAKKANEKANAETENEKRSVSFTASTNPARKCANWKQCPCFLASR